MENILKGKIRDEKEKVDDAYLTAKSLSGVLVSQGGTWVFTARGRTRVHAMKARSAGGRGVRFFVVSRD